MKKIPAQVFIEHYVAQLWGVDKGLLNNESRLLKISLRIAKELKLTVVKSFVHKFEPHGLSLILVISESHLAIHTWPELNYANIDVLSCSKNANLAFLEGVLKNGFIPRRIEIREIKY